MLASGFTYTRAFGRLQVLLMYGFTVQVQMLVIGELWFQDENVLALVNSV